MRFAGGAPSICMQHSGNMAIEGSRDTKLGLKKCKLHMRHYSSIVLFFFLAIVVH